MRNRSLASGLALIAVGALGSCCGSWGDHYLPLKSGAYMSVRGAGFHAVIDRQAETATFTFLRDGKEVVEVWKLTK